MFNSLQACRALAAILVVLQHTNHSIFRLEKYFGHEPAGRLFACAFSAIDFFYVLCGFIMLHVHAKDIDQPRELGSYLWKRFSRIYLFYWVVLAVTLPVYFLVPTFGVGFERDPDVIIRSFLLAPHPEFHMVFGIAWTLVYEVLFYLLFGLLILNKRLGIAVFLVWGCLVLAHPLFVNHPWKFVFSDHHLRFFAGMCVWLVLNRWKIPAPRLVAGAGVTILLVAGLCEDFYGPLTNFARIFWFTLGSAIIIIGLVESERSGLIRAPRWLVYLGDAAYSIYLVHFLALSVFAKMSKAMLLDQYLPSMVLYLLFVIGSIGFGCLCYQFVEYPLHRWSRQFFSRAKSPIPVVLPEPEIRKAA